jgi:hypothetical protein
MLGLCRGVSQEPRKKKSVVIRKIGFSPPQAPTLFFFTPKFPPLLLHIQVTKGTKCHEIFHTAAEAQVGPRFSPPTEVC